MLQAEHVTAVVDDVYCAPLLQAFFFLSQLTLQPRLCFNLYYPNDLFHTRVYQSCNAKESLVQAVQHLQSLIMTDDRTIYEARLVRYLSSVSSPIRAD